jgi:uncharacterized damage-inducible protein DinB
MTQLAVHYLEEILRQLRGHKRLAEGALAQVTEEEFFRELDPESNSLAALVKHMAGNMRSRFTSFLSSDGEKPDRNRDAEFEIDPDATRGEMMRAWEQGWKRVFDAVTALKAEDLERTVTIRREPHTVLQALNRALTHLAQHTSQIVFLAKHFKSTQWSTLSIPRGQSEQFNARIREKTGKIR